MEGLFGFVQELRGGGKILYETGRTLIRIVVKFHCHVISSFVIIYLFILLKNFCINTHLRNILFIFPISDYK